MYGFQCLRLGLGHSDKVSLKPLTLMKFLWGLVIVCQIPIALLVLSEWLGQSIWEVVQANLLLTVLVGLGLLAGLLLCRTNHVTRVLADLFVDGALAMLVLVGMLASAGVAINSIATYGSPFVLSAAQSAGLTGSPLDMWNELAAPVRNAILIACGALAAGTLIGIPRLTWKLIKFMLLLLLLAGSAAYCIVIANKIAASPFLVAAVGLTVIVVLRGAAKVLHLKQSGIQEPALAL